MTTLAERRVRSMRRKPITLRLGLFEAEELANYLSDADHHLSVGDRLYLARRIYQRIDHAHPDWRKGDQA